MKNLFKFIAVAAGILLALSLSACGQGDKFSANPPPSPDPSQPTALSATETEKIERAWLDENDYSELGTDDISLDVRARYGDTVVFYVNGPFGYASAITYDYVDGVLFTYPDSQQLCVYRNGDIYDLEHAYEAGALTRNQLIWLLSNYNNGWNWSTTQTIIDDYVAEHEGTDANTLSLRVYYMCNGGMFALFVDGDGDYTTALSTEVIDGVTFNYPTGQRLLFYGLYDGELKSSFTSLERAFERELLTHTDLENIAKNLESNYIIYID